MFKHALAASFAVLVIAGAGCAPTVAPSLPAPVKPNPPTSMPSAPSPGWEEIEANASDGPWKRDLMMAKSADGTAFGAATTFVERAGVPSVVREADGRLVAAFQWFPQDDAAWDKVAVSFSEDDGATWTEPRTIALEGLPENYQRPFDPTLAVTEDGRLRLYFTTAVGKPGPNADTHIASAVSDDGVTYAVEPGERVIEEGVRLYDAAALRFDGTWHLTTPLHAEGATHATSANGTDFASVEPIDAYPTYNWTGNLLAWGDGMRFYGSGPGPVWWSETADGDDWSKPVPTGVRGGDPAVVELGNGAYLMIYVGEPKP